MGLHTICNRLHKANVIKRSFYKKELFERYIDEEKMKLSRYEQETIVNYNAGEQTATVYTRDKAVMRKLDTLVADFPDIYSLTEQDEVSKTYFFPKSYINYRKPRAISTEQMMIERNRDKEDCT